MDEIEERLDELNLDNAYRFEKCHLIKAYTPKETYQEEDEFVDNLPIGMRISCPFGIINPKNNYAFNTRNRANNEMSSL